MNSACGLLLHARLATLAGDDCGLLDDGALAWRDGRIAWIGASRDLPREFDDLRGSAAASSASSLAARVASTVARMPPPEAAMAA